MGHQVVEHVEQFRRMDEKPQFFAKLPHHRFDVAFTMVDSSSRKVEFSSERPSGFTNEDDPSVVHGYDGVRAGADGKDVHAAIRLRDDDTVPSVRERGDLPGLSEERFESGRIGGGGRVVVIENADLPVRRKYPEEFRMEAFDVESGFSYHVRSEYEVLARGRHVREVLGESGKAPNRGETFRIVSAPEEHFHMDPFEILEVLFHNVPHLRGLPFPVRDPFLLVFHERADRFEVFLEACGDVRFEKYRVGYDDLRSVAGDDMGEPRESSAHVDHVLTGKSFPTGFSR